MFFESQAAPQQRLESQVAIRKPAQVSWRELPAGFSQLVSDFIEAAGKLIFGCSSQKENQQLLKTFSAQTKRIV